MNVLGITLNHTQDLCLRCGQCCHYVIDGKLSNVPCQHLRLNGDGTTHCSVYDTRLNRKIGHHNSCIMRAWSTLDYYGCPYNKGGRPLWRVTTLDDGTVVSEQLDPVTLDVIEIYDGDD